MHKYGLPSQPPSYSLSNFSASDDLASAIVANKTGTRLAHLESGLRSFDRTMPEEINRLLTDEITDEYFVTEQSGLDHLAREGANGRVHFVGNTMIDTLVAFEKEIQESPVLEKYSLTEAGFVLMTMHRPGNVDTKSNLLKLLGMLNHATKTYKVVFPIHPRTKKMLKELGIEHERQHMADPMSYLEFNYLVERSFAVVTDSGGITEETTVMGVPCLTLRDNTERPETITVGTNELIGTDPKNIAPAMKILFAGKWKKGGIPDLWDGKTARRIVDELILL